MLEAAIAIGLVFALGVGASFVEAWLWFRFLGNGACGEKFDTEAFLEYWRQNIGGH